MTNVENLKRLLRQVKKEYELRSDCGNLFGSDDSPTKLISPGLNAPLKVRLPPEKKKPPQAEDQEPKPKKRPNGNTNT